MEPTQRAELVLRANIEPGSVYYFPDEKISSPESHYFVVININPKSDPQIYLVCASTRISSVRELRKNSPSGTLVVINPMQYRDFPYESILDCNQIHRRTLAQLAEKNIKGQLQVKRPMDLKLVQRLRDGALQSRQVAKRVKNRLRAE